MNAAATSMLEIIEHIEGALARGEISIGLDVLDPDLAVHRHAGEVVEVDGTHFIHRPFRVWVDLAERLRLRLRTPRPLDPPLVRLTFEKLLIEPHDLSSHPDSPPPERPTDKYGTDSAFARVRKLEDPAFVIDLLEALERVVTNLTKIRAQMGTTKPRAEEPEPATDADASEFPVTTGDAGRPLRVLDLGVNTGDELALILARAPALRDATFVGVDHSPSALVTARERFASHSNISFVEGDIANLGAFALGRFDVVIAIGLLQSGALDDRELLRRIVQDHLVPRGAVILGMPNCRYVDGEVEYGARIVNITQPELGLLVKDVAFYRKYLQQHHRKVFVTGKHYVLVTAIAE
jgi:SAM-dependent methyltransferase